MILAVTSWAQSDALLDIPTAPVRIWMDDRQTGLTFSNRSDFSITRICLGAVKVDQGKYIVVSRLSNVVINPPPLERGQMQDSPLVRHRHDIERTLKMKARYAVVEVEFEDGSIWIASAVRR